MRYLLYRLLLLFVLIPIMNGSTFPKSAPLASVQASPYAGIQTSGGYTAQSLVKDIFAKGACDNISNIKAIGNPDGMGYFENGKSSIGMDRGIIIATGSIKQAEGPNQAGDKSGNLNDNTGDADLAKLSTHRILDAVGIEFDFVPLDSFVRFRYVFASEEYCEFVGSVYNDVFGFFVSGLGIEGPFSRNSKNVALIPGSNSYVAINTVNHNQNSEYFIRNELEKDSRQCGIDPINSPYKDLIEYDGFTKILTATLQLVPCETYHIRFVVSDVADRHYDSAVFLEAESFNIGGTVQISAQGNNQNTAMEGCQEAAFVFERGELNNLDKPLSVHFKIAAESTATEGVDFAPLPRTVTIPIGQKSIKVPVRAFNDGIAEGTEKLAIELDIPCACYSGGANLDIIDSPPLQVTLPEAFVCRNSTTTLAPIVSGGVTPYIYKWSNGATTASIQVTSGLIGNYAVTVSDQCGNVGMDSARVTPIEPPSGVLSGEARICAGDTAHLPVALVGTPPWRLTYTINGVEQTPIDHITTAHYALPATKKGLYELIKVEDAGCAGAAIGTAKLEVAEIEIDAIVENVSCADGNNGAIHIQNIRGNAPFHYQWNAGLGQQSTLTHLKAGVYTVTINDNIGCDAVFENTITEPAPLSQVVFDCNDLTDAAFQFTANGGTPPYLYAIDGVSFTDAAIFKTLEPGRTYTLTIRDAEDCELQQALTMPPVYDKIVELPATLELSIGELYEFKPKLNLAENLVAKIEWQSDGKLSCTDCLHPQVEALTPGVYKVQITDIFGCVGEAAVRVTLSRKVDVYIPTAFSPNGDHFNDFFTIYADENQVKLIKSLLIFDRWGNQLFAATNFFPNDERSGWDGYVDGILPNSGVFVYVATLQLRDGTDKVEKGQIVLIR